MYLKVATCLALLAGCTARGTNVGPTDAGTDVDTGVEQSRLPAVVESSKARVTFKGGELYAATLANGLGIAREELCKELGLYDCVADVHRISLLGVEPYRTGILEPLDNTIVSTPIAVERVALSACTTWARRGIAGDHQAIVIGLYQNLLQREPDPREHEHLEALYAEMAAIGDPKLEESWAAMSCFAVATTTEALFY